jgi:class 3 adenylate cyclase
VPADIVGFSTLAATLAPEAVFNMLNELYARYDALALAFGQSIYKIETIGDACQYYSC